MSFSGKVKQTIEKTIDNQPFFPALELAEFISSYRIPDDLPESTVTSLLVNAMILVNSRLLEYRTTQQAAGIKTLTDVPSETVAGESIQLILYRRAVFCQGKANILRDFPSIDRRAAAENQAKSSEETEDRYLEFTDQAIQQFLGLGGIDVELI